MSKHKSELFQARDYLHPRFYPMWMLFGLLRLISLFPYSIQLKIGKQLGKLLGLLSAKRQHIVDTNLKLCFPEKTDQQRAALHIEAYENLGISLIELGICWWWKAERLKPLIEVKGLEHVQHCLDNKQGVILLSGHFTSLEIGGRALSLFLPFQAMYRTQKNPLFDSYLYTKRDGYLEHIISRKNTRKMIKGIKQLIPTWYAPDQNFTSERNVFAPFFGVPTATISASARLAKSSGAAMIPFYPERKTDGSGYTLWLQPPLENFPSDDDVADAAAINATIEQFALKQPGQYMWIHKRFKTRPEGEPDIY